MTVFLAQKITNVGQKAGGEGCLGNREYCIWLICPTFFSSRAEAPAVSPSLLPGLGFFRRGT